MIPKERHDFLKKLVSKGNCKHVIITFTLKRLEKTRWGFCVHAHMYMYVCD